MSNSILSKRVARLIDIMIKQGLKIEDRYALIDELEKANELEDLSAEFQKRIELAEKYIQNSNTKNK